jgi:ABC-2 type transport system ATP-binding protein
MSFHTPENLAPDVVNGIEVRGLSKALRKRTILEGVDLVVPRGSIAVVEGQNGAGKTTLIRILATVVAPDAGQVRVNGFDVTRQGLEVRRSIGVSFANERSLYWRINAFQNLELFGRIAGLRKPVIAERSVVLLEALHLMPAAGQMVGRMSTGQRQRLMVARALLTDPTVVLLDEPFRGLDDLGLQAMMELVCERVKRGVTALIVAPVIDAVVPIADAVYQIEARTVRLHPISQRSNLTAENS